MSMNTCKYCNKKYEPLKKKSIYCSRQCSDKASSDRMKKYNYKHGMRNTRFYTIWHGIQLRCNTPTSCSYADYGGRGIKCEWSNFEEFMKDMFSSYEEHSRLYSEHNTTIERINSNGNYCKSNCIWDTWSNQAKNTTNRKRNRDKNGRFV